MFPSGLKLGSIIPRVQSKQAQTIIALDFDDQGGKQKRSSFLPASWADDDPTQSKYTSLGTSLFVPPTKPGERVIRQFVTGSKYTGDVNKLGMAGKGIYKFPHGVIYDGFFNKNGEFHGTGSLIYPGGQRVEGIWRHGKLMKGPNCVTAENVPFTSQYCRMPDRRFQIELSNELGAVGQEYLTNAPNPPREIKKDCYDSGEGYFDPKHGIIYDYSDPTKIKSLTQFGYISEGQPEEIYQLIRAMSESHAYLLDQLRVSKFPRAAEIVSITNDLKEKWIKNNCRRAWEEPIGYKKDLYEIWSTVRRSFDYSSQAFSYDVDDETEDDKLIEEFARDCTDLHSTNTPTLYSFIMTPDTPQRRRSDSLLTVQNMLKPRGDTSGDYRKRPSVKTHHIRKHAKKSKRHYNHRTKSIRSRRSNVLKILHKTVKRKKE